MKNVYLIVIYIHVIVIVENALYMGLIVAFISQKMKEKNMQIENLKIYNGDITCLYDNVRGFKHDFANFIQALLGYAEIDDIDGIKKMSKSIFTDCKQTNSICFINPIKINNPAIYRLFVNKYILSKEYDINMNVEVDVNVSELKINTYELCKIFAILLDNAIEAARECDEKIINIRILKDCKANRKLLIIENTYKEKGINLDKIFEKGFTTKNVGKTEHGLGLWNVKKILRKRKNLNLFTTKDKMFVQQLEIYE